MSRAVAPVLALAMAAGVLAAAVPHAAAQSPEPSHRARLSDDLTARLRDGDWRQTTVILTGTPSQISALAERHGLRLRKSLRTGAVVDVPAGRLADLAADRGVDQLSGNHIVKAQMDVTLQSIGADQAHDGSWSSSVGPLTGDGIGVAVIDSGIANVPELKTRIVASVDFTDDRGKGHDQYGHGTHVAGIIAAAGQNKHDGTRGVAPGAHIVNLKVLDESGAGRVDDVVEAIDWAIDHKDQYKLRIVNLSLGGPVLQPWRDDPLCQAVERAWRAGLVVIASAGNLGKLSDGTPVWGGVTTPGISPHAITVGALNTKNTPWRSDDELATYSSKGPTRFDRLIKPDLVAPGNRIKGLLAPGSTLSEKYPHLIVGTGRDARIELSGTSMAAAVTSGAAAVVLQRRPGVSPFGVRTLLQVSAEPTAKGLLREGAGSIHLLTALALPKVGAIVSGESARPGGVAFTDTTVWNEILLEASRRDLSVSTVVWGATDETVVWGAHDDETVVWGAMDETVVWGASDTVVWGAAADDETVVWGATETVVWGASDETVVWGASEDETVVWGASDETVVWGASDETVVWGANDETVVWGAGDETVVWGATTAD